MQQPLFILCPMRSYSSVVCAMLGEHPQMYGLPEVNLFIADNVDQLLTLHERRPHGLHGLLRTLAQLNDNEQTDETIGAAREWLEQRRQWTTRQVVDHIREAVDPKIVIDKSPRTALKPEYLRRAYAMYPECSFLHLTRHPRSTCNSLLRNISQNARWGGTAQSDNVDPEQIWVNAHQNVVDFCSSLPLGQCMQIKGEDLISNPDLYLPQICEWMDIDAGPEAVDAMKHPERSVYAHTGPAAAPYGNDPDFLEQPALRSDTLGEASLQGDLDWAPGEAFSAPAIKLSRRLGYS